MAVSQYWEFDNLRDIYLEDSFVLAIREEVRVLEFSIDFVLKKKHPQYSQPNDGEQYCYRKGSLAFDQVIGLKWLERGMLAAVDAKNEVDFGNIDTFVCRNDEFELAGEWGHVRFRSAPPRVRLNSLATRDPDQ